VADVGLIATYVSVSPGDVPLDVNPKDTGRNGIGGTAAEQSTVVQVVAFPALTTITSS
jgi:hypothetical protein